MLFKHEHAKWSYLVHEVDSYDNNLSRVVVKNEKIIWMNFSFVDHHAERLIIIMNMPILDALVHGLQPHCSTMTVHMFINASILAHIIR